MAFNPDVKKKIVRDTDTKNITPAECAAQPFLPRMRYISLTVIASLTNIFGLASTGLLKPSAPATCRNDR
jgi:hypothetical protein